MATYKRSLTKISYDGWSKGAGVIYFFGAGYWGFTVTGEVVYRDKKRYLHVSKIVINAKVTIREALKERILVCEEDPSKNACICYWKNEPVYKEDILNTPSGQPGGGQVKVRCITNTSNPNGTIYKSKTVGINLGTGLTSKLRASVNGAQTWTGSSTVTTNFDLELTNNKCYLNLYLQTWGGTSTDWGNLTSGTFNVYVPNTPGAQYYTGSKWETHKVKRYNGSAWVDIPAKRYNGSAWADTEG